MHRHLHHHHCCSYIWCRHMQNTLPTSIQFVIRFEPDKIQGGESPPWGCSVMGIEVLHQMWGSVQSVHVVRGHVRDGLWPLTASHLLSACESTEQIQAVFGALLCQEILKSVIVSSIWATWKSLYFVFVLHLSFLQSQLYTVTAQLMLSLMLLLCSRFSPQRFWFVDEQKMNQLVILIMDP